MDELSGVLGSGWAGWVQQTGTQVITSTLDKNKPATTGVTATSAGVVAAPAASGTIAGVSTKVMLIAGVAVLAVGFFLLRK